MHELGEFKLNDGLKNETKPGRHLFAVQARRPVNQNQVSTPMRFPNSNEQQRKLFQPESFEDKCPKTIVPKFNFKKYENSVKNKHCKTISPQRIVSAR